MSMESMDKKSPIRRARERKGLTQRHLAELLGMDGQTVGSWERGTRFPHVEVRAKLSEVLGTSLEDLGLQERETQAMMEKSPEDLSPRQKFCSRKMSHEKAEEEVKRRETASKQEEIVLSGRKKKPRGGRSWMHPIYY